MYSRDDDPGAVDPAPNGEQSNSNAGQRYQRSTGCRPGLFRHVRLFRMDRQSRRFQRAQLPGRGGTVG